MKTLIIMHGCSGSGKSWLAKSIQSKNNAPIFSTDSIWMVDDEYFWSAEALGEAHKVNQIKVKVAASRNLPCIIVDNTNLTFREIEPYLHIAKQYGYDVELVTPTTPWRDSASALYENNQHDVPLDVIKKQMIRKENFESLQQKIRAFLAV